MGSLRHRKAFQDDAESPVVTEFLDETEQEELIETLREKNATVDWYYLLVLQLIVMISATL
jgi:hypothetical protein